MSVAQVIIVVRLLAGIYGVDVDVFQCIVERESDYDVAARNGVNAGLVQWNPDTLAWLGQKAASDPAWLHGHMDASEPVYQVALAAWAISRGYGTHWSTYSGCGGSGNEKDD